MLTPDALREIANQRVVVVGDALLDRFTETQAERRLREPPAPTVRLDAVRSCPGGAANTAANLAGLGASVELVSVVGDDAAGRELISVLADRRVGLAGMVTMPGWSTPLLNRLRADGELLVRVDQGAEVKPGAQVGSRLADLLYDLAPAADAVIVSDYGRGAVTDAVVDAVARLAAPPDRPLVAMDARRLARYQRARPAVVKPSWEETVALLGPGVLGQPQPRRRAEAVTRHAQAILALTGARIAAVTLDRDGAVVLERDRPPHHTSVRPTSDDRATGAGDTFLAAFTVGLTSGLPTPSAADLAAAAASVVVQERFTAQCTSDALAEALARSLNGFGQPRGETTSDGGRRPAHLQGGQTSETAWEFGPARADEVGESGTASDKGSAGANGGRADSPATRPAAAPS